MEPKDDKGSIPVSQLELLFLAAISTTGFSPQNSISDLEIAAAVINPIDTMKKNACLPALFMGYLCHQQKRVSTERLPTIHYLDFREDYHAKSPLRDLTLRLPNSSQDIKN